MYPLHTFLRTPPLILLTRLAPPELRDHSQQLNSSFIVFLPPLVLQPTQLRTSLIRKHQFFPFLLLLIDDHLLHGLLDVRIQVGQHEGGQVGDFLADHGGLGLDGLLAFAQDVANDEVEQKAD